MSVPNIEVFVFVLTPGGAEALEKTANSTRSFERAEKARYLKHARNDLYLYIALTAIAVIGAALSDKDHTIKKYACATVAILGVSQAALAAKRLYNATLFLLSAADRLRAQEAADAQTNVLENQANGFGQHATARL